MKHNNSESKTSQAQTIFKEFMLRGDDFYKIELLRQAKNYYLKALNLDVDNETAKACISECETLLSYENKVVTILITVVSVLVLLCLIFLF